MNRLKDNPEISKILNIQKSITAVCVAVISLIDIKCGLVALLMGISLISAQLFSVKKRYKKFSELSLDIDRVLHGETHINLEKYNEGELAVLQDELHKMLCRLQYQKERLESDKIYLADSIADISHQIRTPITSINLLVAMLSEQEIPDGKRLEITRRLFDMLSRIDWLVTSLLKISRLDTQTVRFRKEIIPLEKLIRQAVNPLIIPMELHGINLEINAVGDFSGDIEWTSEAIGNIVKNCMEHTETGGNIFIRAEDKPLFAEIIISDDGKGIPEEDLPHIFERFYKGRNSDEKGFGIGLSLARMIVASQNGTLKAENKNGAVFTMRFYKSAI
ncbi:MAG: HAMP domain-containing histidine kinase [Ruminococcus sp.]|nr:HAMP domain-containing histidine kinase [Ruminococcus sp.]